MQNKKLPTSVSCDEGEVSEEEEDDSVVYSNGNGQEKTINENETKNGALNFPHKNKTSVTKVTFSCSDDLCGLLGDCRVGY